MLKTWFNAKNLWKWIFRASRRATLSYFPKVPLDHWRCPQIPFRLLVDDQSKLCVTSKMELFVTKNCLVCKRVSTPPFQNHPTITRFRSFFKISHPPRPHSPTLPINWSSQVFLTNRNAAVKFSSINTIHVKQQYWLFHFQVHSKVHARWCLY